MKMEINKVKEQLNSLIKVMNEAFNVKKNPLSEYAIPILRDALSLIEEQKEKIHILERKKQTLERALDEVKFKYFSELTELQGKIEDYERERTKLIRETRLTTPRKKSPVRIWIKPKEADD